MNHIFLQLSFHGVPWIAGSFAMLYLGYSQYLWINLLVLLFVDIIFISITKAFTRRRRPQVPRNNLFTMFALD